MAELERLLLAAIFPRSCVRCGREGALCCITCQRERPFTPPEPSEDHVAAFAYGNPLVRDLIKAWKYEFDASAWHLLRTSAQTILPQVKQLLGQGRVAVVPIPLSRRRQCERGFNQSSIVAHWLAHQLNLPVIEGLARRHSAGHQAGLSTEQRLALAKAPPFLLKQNLSTRLADFDSILLVDDVFTTGSTLAAARSVLEPHFKRVVSFTLAKS